MAFFLESTKSLAKRCGLEETKEADFGSIIARSDPRTLIPFLLTRLLVDASDFNLKSGNNADLLATTGQPKLVVPYDFNDSGKIVARGFSLGFDGLNESLVKLRDGPFLDSRGTMQTLSEDKIQEWRAELYNQAAQLLTRREEVLRVLETIPFLETDAGAEIHAHILHFFDQLRTFQSDRATIGGQTTL